MGLISNVIATKWKSGEFGVKPNWIARNTGVRIGSGMAIASGVGYHVYQAIHEYIYNPVVEFDELTYPLIAGAAVLIAAVTTEYSAWSIVKASKSAAAADKKAPDRSADKAEAEINKLEAELNAAEEAAKTGPKPVDAAKQEPVINKEIDFLAELDPINDIDFFADLKNGPAVPQPPMADRSKHEEPARPSSHELFERANKAIDELEMLGKEAEALENRDKLMENAAASKPDTFVAMIAKICARDIRTLDTGLDIVELFLENREKQRWTRQYIDTLILLAQAFFGEIKNTSDLPNFDSFDEREKLDRAAMITNALVMIYGHMGYGPEEDEEKEPFPLVIERLRQKAEAARVRSSRED